MAGGKTIVFFPEAALGPALNSVGIAQACRDLGHRPVFVADVALQGTFAKYDFEERLIHMSEPMDAAATAQYWQDFITGQLPNFRTSPYEQIGTYVKACWDAIVETSVWAEKELPATLAAIKPDLICVDNVVLFPATKRYGKPWVRIISCSENEIEDPDIPPHLSGCGATDRACFAAFRARFAEVIKPIHDRFNAFLGSVGHPPYPVGEFFEASPYLNLLLYPEPVKFKRRHPLDPKRFQYLEGCVREEAPYAMPAFTGRADAPVLYVSFGSLGSSDVELMRRLIAAFGKTPYRFLVNVGDLLGEYGDVPGNVHLASFFPQPSVIPQVDAVIHHGGNNSFTECLYFGKPAIIMPYCWDGHDNATRVHETGHGLKLDRYRWTDAELATAIAQVLDDEAMRAKLAASSVHMRASDGRRKAAGLLDHLLATA
ncbi:MAG: glycosyl transferase family 1 [Alphaproteobacteria bacterium]|nr:glycosyl transferase family 1 [Alphaproteobacteria bacterium]